MSMDDPQVKAPPPPVAVVIDEAGRCPRGHVAKMLGHPHLGWVRCGQCALLLKPDTDEEHLERAVPAV